MTPRHTAHPEQLIRERVTEVDRGYSTPCWVWQRAKFTDGYGTFRYNDKQWRVHRLAYTVFVGPIGDALVCHRCDQRDCCNPDHLYLGTQQANMRDMSIRGRARNQNKDKTHCKRGHELVGNSVYTFAHGGRACRACRLGRIPQEAPRWSIGKKGKAA